MQQQLQVFELQVRNSSATVAAAALQEYKHKAKSGSKRMPQLHRHHAAAAVFYAIVVPCLSIARQNMTLYLTSILLQLLQGQVAV